jgi:hypothetical protein
MIRRVPVAGDERNASFGIPAETAQHKPGFHAEIAKPAVESKHHAKAHRRRPQDPSTIPQTPLAKRLREPKKGGK